MTIPKELSERIEACPRVPVRTSLTGEVNCIVSETDLRALLTAAQGQEWRGWQVGAYDEPGDVLYLSDGEPQGADHSRDVDGFVWRFLDGKVIGLTILDFLERAPMPLPPPPQAEGEGS